MLDPASPDLLHPVFAVAVDQIWQIDARCPNRGRTIPDRGHKPLLNFRPASS
ncbi:hypothetical protein [Rhodopila globiformis]|jgi:hypothetical protein|uniref:hypothetical protein n=1 Tax=Rhodopila globiformis TaxID=1071 RepID=UPI001304A90D|nr:hypothetical protein [Rhodopila globiformis]